ncbi:MAG: hypothetical protein WAM60_00275 [Candidatus Promineifilaceae bacterium]
MIIIRDDEKVARYKKWAQRILILGLVCLVGGMVMLFVLNSTYVVFLQTAALLAGYAFSQVGSYLAHRYVRSPRPDETLDKAVKPVAGNGRMYHFILPAPHVLLTPSGPIVFNLKFQNGDVSYKNGKWKQRGIGLRGVFGQEGLGKPDQETEAMVSSLAGFIHKHDPEIEEVPIGAIIVFTAENMKGLDVDGSEIPALHHSKVRKFLRREGLGKPLPEGTYQALQTIFDNAAEKVNAL